MKEVEALIYDLINGDEHLITYKEMKCIIKYMKYMNIPKYSEKYVKGNSNVDNLFFAFIQNFKYCINYKQSINKIIYHNFLCKLSHNKSIKNTTHVTFGYDFNQPLDDSIKKSAYLQINNKFNQPLDDSIKNATHVQFGYSFNQPLGDSIQNATHVEFGINFNQPLGDSTKNATHVQFGWNFNQPLGDSIKNATHVEFGINFNQPLGD